MTKIEADTASVGILQSLGIATDNCKRATIYLEAGEEPVIEVTYSLMHVPVFNKIEELTKHYALVDKSKEYLDG